MKTVNALLASAVLMLTNCTYVSEGVVVNKDRYAETTPADIFGDSTDKVVYLEQNWDRYDSLWFYFTTQGSDFMPYDLFLNLEQTNSEALFRNAENMNKFRFLTQKPSYDNPEGLPVGIVKDSYQGKDYMGFTCAACHTAQINYKGTGIRIDGGPTLTDFEGFFEGVAKAIKATLDDAGKFERLAQKMIAKGLAENQQVFRKELEEIYRQRSEYNVINAPKQGNQLVHYGYGRLDAFGRIYNRIFEHLTPGQPNSSPANAPVSFPFLWDTPQHDFVQWNGVASNNPGGRQGFLGPLNRNIGEVLGVFATFEVMVREGEEGFRSSAVKRNLIRLEDHLVPLWSPLWPEDVLPPIDRNLAKQGKQVFNDYKCNICHGDPEKFDRRSPDRRVIAQFASLPRIGTDSAMAVNAVATQGNSGAFKGQPVSAGAQAVFGDTTRALPALQKTTAGVVLEPDHDVSAARRAIEQAYDFMVAALSNPIKVTPERHVDFEVNDAIPASLLAYKARTLNGIWATAPYLHNGSVPTLYDLFLPSCSDAEIAAGKKCRANHFTVGSREFDPIKVGLVSKDKTSYPGVFEFDTAAPGNRNNGHEYAAGNTPIIKLDDAGKPVKNAAGQFETEKLPPISDSQRQALIEYLKTL